MKKENEVYMYKKSIFPNKVIEKILRVINTVINTDKRQGECKTKGCLNLSGSPLFRVKFSFYVGLLGIFTSVQIFQKLFL